MYQGEWVDNNMDGMGVYTWADGRCYIGEYMDDKKHGYGIYKWADGRLYLGQWVRGKQNGLGIYKTQDTNFKYGLWEDGKRIEWFDEQTIHEIKTGEKDYRMYFTRKENQESNNYISQSFDKPEYFDQKLAEISERLGISIDQ